jgi:hypothetical protein
MALYYGTLERNKKSRKVLHIKKKGDYINHKYKKNINPVDRTLKKIEYLRWLHCMFKKFRVL